MGSCLSSPATSDGTPGQGGTTSVQPPPPPPPFPVPQLSPPGPSFEYLQTPLHQKSLENILSTLSKYDTVIIVDDSYSMTIDDRWSEASNALSQLTEKIQEYDSDGVDLYFLNEERCGVGLKTKAQVQDLFNSTKPTEATPLGDKLDKLLRSYLQDLRSSSSSPSSASPPLKPRNYIIITDGCPTDDPTSVILSIAQQLDQGGYPLSQIGIQFLQIGNDPGATRYLKELDDELGVKVKGGVRDIVDTTPYLGTKLTSDMILKVLLGGINRRQDKKVAHS